MRILIADDTGVIRKLISRSLIDYGISADNIVEAEDGEQALAVAQNQSFDLILMDSHMPRLPGIPATAAIRKLGIDSPILMMTAGGEKTTLSGSYASGANQCIVKPFSPTELKAKISQMFYPVHSDVAS